MKVCEKCGVHHRGKYELCKKCRHLYDVCPICNRVHNDREVCKLDTWLNNNRRSDKCKARRLLNENAFSGSLDENASYFIGVLQSDGCIMEGQNGRQKRVILKMNDFDIVENFGKFMNWENGVKRGTRKLGNDFAIIEFSSDKVADDLINIGVTIDKTFNEIFPKGIILNDYLRGMLDGDGSINRSNGRWTLLVTGKSIKDEIENKLNELELPFNTIPTYKNTIFQQYTIYGKGGIKGYLKFLDYIYSGNGYRGKRKESIYKSFKDKYTKSAKP